jgi:hypothetical protein
MLMSSFSQKKTPEEFGSELFRRFERSVDRISNALSSIDNKEGFFQDFNAEKLLTELTILVYIGQRLALQLIHKKKPTEIDLTTRREICNALDRYASEFFGDSKELDDLLDQRGEQYHKLVMSHLDEIHKEDWGNFCESLQFKFVQFCRGGGGENDPFILGDFFVDMQLWNLSTEYWVNGFTETAAYIKEQGL